MDQPASLNCPACGAPLDYDGTSAVVRCKFCGNVSLIPGVSPTKTAVPDSALDEIRQLAGSGNLIEAIKRYREIYGVGLAEAKDGVEALQAGRLATPSVSSSYSPEELTKTLQEVQRLLAAGNEIDAIKVYRGKYDVSLARAKYAVEQIEAGRTTWPEAGFPAPEAQAEKPSSTSRSGQWLGCGIAAAIILFVAGILAVVFLQPGGPLNKHYIPNGPAALISSGQGATADFALLLYNPDKDTRFIGLMDGATGKLRWQAPALSGDGYADAIVAGTDLVYAANSTDLLAYHAADGTLAWQAEMPDKLNYGTATMLVTAGRVITDNNDQSIQAYDAASGSLVWSRRLDGYDRVLRLIDNSLVLIDYVDTNHDFGLIFLDPATGSQQRVITPTCTYQDYSFDALDPDAGLAYDPAEGALYLVFEASYACAMRIDLASGQTAWQVTGEEGFNFVPDGFQSLMTDSTLYFSDGNDLLAVDKSSGAMKVLLTDPDNDLLPLAVAGDTLIVRARRTRGSERFALWGVNATSGEQVWQKDLQDTQPIDPPDEMVGLVDDTDWGWTWKLLPDGLMLITFQAEPNQVVLENINPADGSSQGQQTLALKKITGDFYSIPTIIGWQGNLGYINLEADLYLIDLSAGQLKSIY